MSLGRLLSPLSEKALIQIMCSSFRTTPPPCMIVISVERSKHFEIKMGESTSETTVNGGSWCSHRIISYPRLRMTVWESAKLEKETAIKVHLSCFPQVISEDVRIHLRKEPYQTHDQLLSKPLHTIARFKIGYFTLRIKKLYEKNRILPPSVFEMLQFWGGGSVSHPQNDL